MPNEYLHKRSPASFPAAPSLKVASVGVESAAHVCEHVPLNSLAGRVKERGKGFPSKKIKIIKKLKNHLNTFQPVLFCC